MNKIALAVVAAASLATAAPLLVTTPAYAQVDVQIGGDHDRDRGHGPGIVVGEHRRCHMVTITERHHDREVTRQERRCD